MLSPSPPNKFAGFHFYCWLPMSSIIEREPVVVFLSRWKMSLICLLGYLPAGLCKCCWMQRWILSSQAWAKRMLQNPVFLQGFKSSLFPEWDISFPSPRIPEGSDHSCCPFPANGLWITLRLDRRHGEKDEGCIQRKTFVCILIQQKSLKQKS